MLQLTRLYKHTAFCFIIVGQYVNQSGCLCESSVRNVVIRVEFKKPIEFQIAMQIYTAVAVTLNVVILL